MFSQTNSFVALCECKGAGVAQSVRCLTTDWATGFRSPGEAKHLFY